MTKRFLVSPAVAESLSPKLRSWVVVSPFVPDDAAFLIDDAPPAFVFALDDAQHFRVTLNDWELARFHAAERLLGSSYRRLRRRVRRLVKGWLARVGIHLPAGWVAPRPRLAGLPKRQDMYAHYPPPVARAGHGIIMESA